MNRRFFLMAIPGLLAACTGNGNYEYRGYHYGGVQFSGAVDPYYHRIYGAVKTEPYPVPSIDLRQVRPQFLRREVTFSQSYAPGTIVIKTSEHYAYYVLPGGKAIRYGIGVAHSKNANFRGQAVIGRKSVWPSWVPTANMMRTQPARYGHMGRGLPPGVTNPLGARALYLYRNGRDTLFRLHGTIEPSTIGTDVSSGCIRFLNQDIIDLYNRVHTGARVIVSN